MRRLISRWLYKLGLRTAFRDTDPWWYLKRLGRDKPAGDRWYYDDEDRRQMASGEVLVRTVWRGLPLYFQCLRETLVEQAIIRRGLFDADLLEFMADRVAPGARVVDVGANVGAYAVPLARLCPQARVLAVEPNPAILPRLRRNLALNGLTNVEIHALGLSSAPGSLTLHAVAGANPGLSSFSAHAAGDRDVSAVAVPVTTLDALLAGDDSPVSLIKIDVQGHELAVLEGARETLARHRPAILFEYEAPNFPGPAEARAARRGLAQLLEGAGYAVFYLSAWGPGLSAPVTWEVLARGNLLALPTHGR